MENENIGFLRPPVVFLVSVCRPASLRADVTAVVAPELRRMRQRAAANDDCLSLLDSTQKYSTSEWKILALHVLMGRRRRAQFNACRLAKVSSHSKTLAVFFMIAFV